jgi:hypothetical protein
MKGLSHCQPGICSLGNLHAARSTPPSWESALQQYGTFPLGQKELEDGAGAEETGVGSLPRSGFMTYPQPDAVDNPYY